MLNRLLLFLFLSVIPFYSNAQVTTASVYGFIRDDKGVALPGATVAAVHLPTGAQYGVTTRSEGEYNLPNLRVGGPYTITISYVGFQNEVIENV